MFQSFKPSDPATGLGISAPGAFRVVTALTPREREIMGWLSGGKTDRDIAAILGISWRTVHKHLQHIYEKLGVETRTAAAARWWRMGA